jgi:VWFA-related protein
VRPLAAIGLGVTTAAVAAGLTLAAQDQLPQPTFRTEANYVRVDVYPTRDGAPVTDLTAADFEVVEDKVPQKVEQFEHIVIRSAGTQEGRREPNTVAESRGAIQDPRARVFVLFLDPKHVELGASRQIGQPMIDALNRLIGPDDYVATMMPGMSARDITFARRTTSIENVLKRDWWGGRDRLILDDPVENQYAYCYPGIPGPGQTTASDQGIAQAMILRRREQQTLDALEDLVVFLHGVREERKAVLAITDGWLLYGPNSNLIRPLGNARPPTPVLGVDPRSGKLTTQDTQNPAAADNQGCERDRLALSQIDDEPRFRTILDEANRANASFYPIDPRGLVVFDQNIVPAAGVGVGPNANPSVPAVQDQAQLTARVTSLRRLAEGTDGTAVVATNNIAPALRRIGDDLSSYYLLGYYSTGKLDGRFHAITVRVKRPGVSVRARRGYQAPRAADLTKAALPPPTSAAASADMAITAAALSAIANMTGSVRDLPLRVHVTAGWRAGAEGRPVAAFWTVGEVVDRIPGSDLEAVVTTRTGEIVATARGRIVPGVTSALVAVVPSQSVEPGDYVVRVRSQSPSGTETLSMPVTLPPASQSSGAVFIHRGPLTGNKEMPAADLRFRRSERLRVEVPSAADAAGARLLDRTGKPLAVPVVAATRTDADGTRWATGELALAPLGAGDYLIEVSAGATRTLLAFRVVL